MSEQEPVIQGCLPDESDERDWSYEGESSEDQDFQFGYDSPTLVDYSSPVHNQRSTNSCVAQSVIKATEIRNIIMNGRDAHRDLSICHLWYLCREQAGNQNNNTGTRINTACKVLRNFGVALEEDYPFVEANFYKSPPMSLMRKAFLNRSHGHYRIFAYGPDRTTLIIDALRSGYPVVFGMNWGGPFIKYDGTEPVGIPRSDKDGNGNHAMTIVGFDANKFGGSFLVENSWGERWGVDGYCHITPEVISGVWTRDLWVIKGMEADYV